MNIPHFEYKIIDGKAYQSSTIIIGTATYTAASTSQARRWRTEAATLIAVYGLTKGLAMFEAGDYGDLSGLLWPHVKFYSGSLKYAITATRNKGAMCCPIVGGWCVDEDAPSQPWGRVEPHFVGTLREALLFARTMGLDMDDLDTNMNPDFLRDLIGCPAELLTP